MHITIHRGIAQVGGCITEISTDTTRIFVDMGDNLIGAGEVLTLDEKRALVSQLFQQNIREHEAVFFTHSHVDHVGMIDLIPLNVPKYMSQGTKDLMLIIENVIKTATEYAPDAPPYDDTKEKILNACNTWQRPKNHQAPKSITVGDITVTPFFVSHSTYDASMLLIEANGKKVLHTGDYRGHGYLSKGLFPTLNRYVGQVDYLITEGTMLNSDKECPTELEISNRMYYAMLAFRYVFVLTSSTDIERLLSVHHAAGKAGRRFVSCALNFHNTIDYFNQHIDSRPFASNVYKYSTHKEDDALIARMQKEGFAMVMGASHGDKATSIMRHFDPAQTLLIYAAWDGYYKDEEQVAANPNYRNFRQLFDNVIDLHTSGHADAATITKVIETVNPRKGIIGIHKDATASLTSLNLSSSLLSKIIPENNQPNNVTIK